MKMPQAAGYIFERVVFKMLERGGYVKVKSKKLMGRGASHQIDAFGTLSIPTPFVNPIRLISEAKCWSGKADLPEIRSFFGVVKDISEKYDSARMGSGKRWTDSGCFFSVNGFTKEAQNFAWAHNIYLVSFPSIPTFDSIYKKIRSHVGDLSGLESMAKVRLVRESTALINEIAAGAIVVGVLDGVYPVAIFSSGELNEYLAGLPTSQAEINAHKSDRQDGDDSSLFTINFGESLNLKGYFEIPNIIAKRIIVKVENSHSDEDVIARVDVPVVREVGENTLKRIIRINVLRR